MSDTSDVGSTFNELESWSDLPSGEEMSVFRIGEYLVGFTPIWEEGALVGWGVTTSDPSYRGYLVNGKDTMTTDRGYEPVRDYSYESKNPYRVALPNAYTVSEFRSMHFGDYSAED